MATRTARGDFVKFQTDSGKFKTGVVIGEGTGNYLKVMVNPDLKVWEVHYCAAMRLGKAEIILSESR